MFTQCRSGSKIQAHDRWGSMSNFPKMTSLFLFLKLVIFTISVSAQTIAPGAPPAITLHTQTTLVEVPVVITDRQGKRVTGLSRDNFRLGADGREQPIASFQEIQTKGTQPHLSDRDPAIQTNFQSSPANPGQSRLTIVVYDGPSINFQDQLRAHREMASALQESLSPGESIALLAITFHGLRVIHDFTQDSSQVLSSLQHLHLGQSFAERAADEIATLPSDLQRRVGDEDTFEPHRRAGQNSASNTDTEEANRLRNAFSDLATSQNFYHLGDRLRALRQIAEAFSGVPGKKNLIWITGGFNFALQTDPLRNGRYMSSVQEMYQKTYSALNAANMAVYPLDVGSMVPDVSAKDQSSPVSRVPVARVSQMEEFAALTGGEMCYFYSNLRACLNQALEDSLQYYLLSFYAPQTRSGWQKLAVKVDLPDVKVRARTGYYYINPDDHLGNSERSRNEELAIALASPVEYRGLPLAVRVERSDHASGVLRFAVLVLPGAVTIDSEHKNHIDLEFAALVADSRGKPIRDDYKNFTGDLQPDNAKAIRSLGIKNEFAIQLPLGEYTVRVAVRDNVSGRIGTVATSSPSQLQLR